MLKLYVVRALLCRNATRKEGDIKVESILNMDGFLVHVSDIHATVFPADKRFYVRRGTEAHENMTSK